MKKTLAIVVMALAVVGFASAKGKSSSGLNNSVDVNFAVPMVYQHYVDESSYLKTTATNFYDAFGFDISDTCMLTKLVGLKASVDFAWPSKMSSDTEVLMKSVNISTKTNVDKDASDIYDSDYDINAFFGLAICPFSKNGLSLTVAPGVNLNWFNFKYDGDDTDHTAFHVGAGADICANYNVTKKVYINASCPVVWYFTEKVDDDTNDDYHVAFQFTPKIGLGYRF